MALSPRDVLTPSAPPPTARPVAWGGLAAAYLLYFSLLGILQPYLATLFLEHGLAPAQAGPSVALLYVLAGAAPLLASGLAHAWRLSLTTLFAVAAAAALALAISLSVCGQSVSHTSYVLLLAALTAAYAPLNAVLDTSALWACTQQGWSFGRLRLMGSLGYIVAATSLGHLLPAHGVSQPVHAAAAAVLAALLIASLWLPRLPADEAARPSPSESPGEVGATARPASGAQAVVRTPSAARLACLVLACGLHYASFGPFQFGFTLYGRSVGLSPFAIGLGWSLGVASEVLCFTFVGALLARLGWRPLLLVAFAVAPARWALLACLPHPATFFVSQLLHGPSFALFYAGAMAGLATVTPRARAQHSQTVFCALVAGLASGPAMWLAGYAYAYLSLGSMFACMLPANVASLGLLLAYGRPAAREGAGAH